MTICFFIVCKPILNLIFGIENTIQKEKIEINSYARIIENAQKILSNI